MFPEDLDNWDFPKTDDPYHLDLNIHAIKTCTFDVFDQGTPDINLSPPATVFTTTRHIYDPTITTLFDLWLFLNQDTPLPLSKSHSNLLNTLDLDPVSTIDPNFFSMTLNPTTPPV
jgi:hypothetical protein